jgi:3-hydroxybutyryl-CoA dehydrogenase
MGAGIAQVAATAGYEVRLFDAKPGAAAQAIANIRGQLEQLVAKGKLSLEVAANAAERLQPADTLWSLNSAALVIEAIIEDLDVKRTLFAELEGIVGADCIFATNTSSISVTAIAAALQSPGRLVGMHFFNPAPRMALVEVVSGLATEADVAETVYATALAWGKRPVHAKSTPGFIVNRVARPFYAEGLRLLNEQAADPATLDALMREAGGFRMGPFELMDLIGHDVNLAVTRSVFKAYFGDPRFSPSLIQQALVDAGRLGRKTKQGFFRYGDDEPAPAIASEQPARMPTNVFVWRATALGDAIASRLQAANAAFQEPFGAPPDGTVLQAGNTRVCITDGRSATQRAADDGYPNTVLADLTLDPATAGRIALAKADQCSDAAFADAAGVFQAAGLPVSRLADVPGLAVMRTVCMLANEAADAVNQGVCDVDAVDTAMHLGVNYPMGPLAWADLIGAPNVLTVLDHLAQTYGEDRYRASPLLRRVSASGRPFHT